MQPGAPFAIPAINNYIPEKLKPWILILFVIIFQFSGGVYLATANEMMSDTGLLHEDILMAGYASLIGMSLTFVIMLRLKMRFTSKVSLLTTTAVLIICNLISLYTENLVVLIVTCFIAGIFRMWGTFEVNSTIQLWLTPTRDLSIFFCFIYLLVNGSVLLSGEVTMYTAFFATWRYMHWLIIGCLLLVILVVLLIFNNKRFMPAFPLFGIDWLGALMWGLILLTINFISIYGENYDYWTSEEIQLAAIFLIILLMLNLYRASFIRHPFISLQTFKYKAVWLTALIYVIVDILLAPAHLLENIYYEKILHYDAAHLIWINAVGWIGVMVGAAFAYYYFALRKNSYKSTFLIGFSGIIIYLLLMYFRMDYHTSQEMLIAPVFFRNSGYVIIAIVLITNLVKVPFHHFFQAVALQAFISAAVGSAFGTAILHHLFSETTARNFTQISSEFDRVNQHLSNISGSNLAQILQQQVLLVSFKEIYGYWSSRDWDVLFYSCFTDIHIYL